MLLTRHYGIPVTPFPAAGGAKGPHPGLPANRLRGVPRFVFGLVSLSPSRREGGGVPALPDLHLRDRSCRRRPGAVTLIVNWAAYLRAQRPVILRPAFDAWRGWNITAQAFDRLKGALQMAGGGDKDKDKKDENKKDKEANRLRTRRRPGRVHVEVPLDVRRLLAARVPRNLPPGERPRGSRRTTPGCCGRSSCPPSCARWSRFCRASRRAAPPGKRRRRSGTPALTAEIIIPAARVF